MGRLIRRVGFWVALLFLLWSGTILADISQNEFAIAQILDEEKIQGLKLQISDVIGQYVERAKDCVNEALVMADQAIDKILEVVGEDGNLENNFSSG